MAKKTINLGTGPNTLDGDKVRTAFGKVNDNFDELYGLVGESGADLSAVNQHIIPAEDVTYDLGSSAKQWRSLYVSSNTIYLGGTALSVSGDNITVDGEPISSTIDYASIPNVPELAAVATSGSYNDLGDLPTIPADVSDLTDTEGLLGGGGNANTGDITFDSATISAPNETNIVVEAKNSSGAANSRLALEPEYAIAKLESFTSAQENFYSGDGYWTTANWTVTQFGYGELAFTGAEQLYAFLNSSTNTWNNGGNKRFSWNGGPLLEFSGWGYGGGELRITLSQTDLPPVDPTEITELRLEWDNISRVAVDSNDYSELQIFGQGIPVEINSTNDVNIEAGDDLRLTGRDLVSIRNASTTDPVTIITSYGSNEKIWEFDTDGELTLPLGGVIRETEVTNNPAIELEPANASDPTQKLIIKGGEAEEPHLHLTTGNLTETSIFLGTDEHNVRTQIYGGIEISARSYINDTSSVWTFFPRIEGEGIVPSKIIFPDGTQQTTAWAGGRVVSVPQFSTGGLGDLRGDMAFGDDYLYYCTQDYSDGITNIWKRVSWSGDTW